MLKFVKYELATFVSKNLLRLFDKYAVARTEHDALVKKYDFFKKMLTSCIIQTLKVKNN